MANAAIALGSNLGNPFQMLIDALKVLDHTTGITVRHCSPFYQTAPVGPPQPDYLNACATLITDLPPTALMQTLLDIELQFGRIRIERWGPRLLDLDLLLYEDLIVDTPFLQIPHPRMRERAFVLMPLSDIAAHWIDPVTGQTMSQLMQFVDCTGVNRLVVS